MTRAARRERTAGRTTRSHRRARSPKTKQARATTARRPSQDAATANARHRGAAHAWDAMLSALASSKIATCFAPDCWSGSASTGSGNPEPTAEETTMQRPTQPGRGQLLAVGSTGSEEGKRREPRRALPRHMGASKARVLGRAFRAEQGGFPRRAGRDTSRTEYPSQRRRGAGPQSAGAGERLRQGARLRATTRASRSRSCVASSGLSGASSSASAVSLAATARLRMS